MSAIKVNTDSHEKEILSKINKLLQVLRIDWDVQYIGEIRSHVFIIMYERLFGQQLKDVIDKPRGIEDEVHNVQMVVDSLSMDVLGVSLSHITGEDVVNLKFHSVANLLDVFMDITTYILGAIDSAPESDVEEPDARAVFERIVNGGDDVQRFHNYGINESHPPTVMPAWEQNNDDSTQFYINDARRIERELELSLSSIKPTPNSKKQLSHSQNAEEEQETSLITPDIPEKTDTRFDYVGIPVVAADAHIFSRETAQTPPISDALHQSKNTSVTDIVDHLSRQPSSNIPNTSTHSKSPDIHSNRTRFTKTQKSQPHMISTSSRLPHSDNNPQDMPNPSASLRPSKLSHDPPKQQQTTQLRTPPSNQNDLPGCSPALRRTLRLLEQRTHELHNMSLTPGLSKSSEKCNSQLTSNVVNQIKQKNVFDRLYNNPVVTAVSKHNNQGEDRRVVEFRNSNINNRQCDRDPPFDSTIRSSKDLIDNRKPARVINGMNSQHPVSSPIHGRLIDEQDCQSFSPQTKQIVKDPYTKFTEALSPARCYHSDPEINSFTEKPKCIKKVKFRTPHSPSSGATIQASSADSAQRRFNRCIKKLSNVYDLDLKTAKDDLYEDLDIDRKTALNVDKEFKKTFGGRKRSTRCYPSRTPSFVSSKARKRSQSASPRTHTSKSLFNKDDDIVNALLDEFPYLYISGETWHELWRKGNQQIEFLLRRQLESRRQKSRVASMIEDADKRQEVLYKLMQKQIAHTQRLREVKTKKQTEIAQRNRIREKRRQIALARRYYSQYQSQIRAKMLKKRTQEEQVFKRLFKDTLDLQKERANEMYRYAKERKVKEKQIQKDELASIENFYKDQFELLAAEIGQEKQDLLIRENAQQKVVNNMKRDLRLKMEREIGDIQDMIFRNNDDVYFRQLDADRLYNQIKSQTLNICP